MESNKIQFHLSYTPEEIRNILLEVGVSPKHLSFHLNKYLYILDLIFKYKYTNKHNGGVCRLYSGYLESTLGKNYYYKIIGNLKTAGLIQQVSNHSTSRNISKGYELIGSEKIRSYEFTSSDGRFIKKLLKGKETRIQKDTDNQKRLIRSMSKLDTGDIQRSLTQDESISISEMKNNPFQVVGRKGKRIYNSFTNLPKSVRKELKLNGEKLVFVDIVNSQMVFLSGVIKDYLNSFNIKIDKSTQDFFEKCSTGEIYELVMDLVDLDRDKSKEKMFMLVFGDKWDGIELRKKLVNRYPQVIQVIDIIKRNDKNHLAHLMQQKESSVVFDALSSIDYFKDVLTIHDSLYSNESNLNLITESLINSFNKFGIVATINVNDQYNISTECTINDKIELIINKISTDLAFAKNSDIYCYGS